MTLPLRDFFNAAFESKREINYATEEVVEDWVSPEQSQSGDDLRPRYRRDGTQRLAEGTGVMKKGGAYTPPEAGSNYRVFPNAKQARGAGSHSGIEMVDLSEAPHNPFRHGSSAIEPELSEMKESEPDSEETATIGSNLFRAPAADVAPEPPNKHRDTKTWQWEVKGEKDSELEMVNDGSVKSCINQARDMLGYPTEIPADGIWLPVTLT